jgi:hypothetical protein
MRRTVVPALIVVVLALAGCADTPVPQATSTASVAATPTPTVAPTPTTTVTAPPETAPPADPAPPETAPPADPAPPETAPPEAAPPVEPAPPTAGCDTVLTAEEYASLDEDGLNLLPDPRAFDDVMQSIMDAGFGCEWKRDGGDIRVWYAQAEQADDSWDAQSQQLVAAGWTPIDTAVGSALQAPPEHDPSFSPGVLHSDGVTYYASYPDLFGSVAALVG